MTDWILKFNKKLNDVSQRVENLIRSIEKDTSEKSTTGKSSEQYYINTEVSNREFVDFKRNLKEFLVSENMISVHNEVEILNCWTVMGYEDCFHKIHRHTPVSYSKDISVVYYISVSEKDINKPGSFYSIVNDQILEYDPEPGDFLVFPVTLYHGTYPQGKGLRQTLNFDIKIN